MIEVAPLSNSDLDRPTSFSEPELPDWEKIGRISLATSSFFAVAAFIPAAMKKKRVYTPLATLATPSTPIIETPIDLSETVRPQPPSPPVPRASDDDRASIRKLFATVAVRSALELGLPWIGIPLWRTGDGWEERGVHPFEILKHARKEDMQAILRSRSDLKIFTTVNGVRKGMEREQANNNITRYIPAFATNMGKSADRITPLIERGRWRELLDYLYDITP